MTIPNLSKQINFQFKHKPLLVGGKAMEYYGLRKSGKDVDYIIEKSDFIKLKKHLEKQGLNYRKSGHKQSYKTIPEFVDLYGDQGLLIFEFEIWNQIVKCDYTFLLENSIKKEHCLVISLDKLLYLKTLAINKRKYFNDVKLIVKKILADKYKT